MRHINFCLCPVGALAFYLSMPFNIMHKFEDSILSDWLDNYWWFDVKLLVDPSGGEYAREMATCLPR
jgi:hypothetical protein